MLSATVLESFFETELYLVADLRIYIAVSCKISKTGLN